MGGWGAGKNPPGGPVDAAQDVPSATLTLGPEVVEQLREHCRRVLMTNGHPDVGPTWVDWVEDILDELVPDEFGS